MSVSSRMSRRSLAGPPAGDGVRRFLSGLGVRAGHMGRYGTYVLSLWLVMSVAVMGLNLISAMRG